MPRPRKVPAVLVEATIRTNAKLAALPSDTARLGYFYAVLGEAKLAKPLPGSFASRSHFTELAGRFARFLPHYLAVGVLEAWPSVCDRCREKWSATPPKRGALVVHDWFDHQYDPRHLDRQAAYEERKRADEGRNGHVSDAQSDGVSDAEPDEKPGVSDAVSDGVSDAGLTGDSRARVRSRASNVNGERRTPNESLEEEDSSSSPRATRAKREDVQALLDRGWAKVTRAQRRVLDEVLERHDVTGPGFAAEVIRATPEDADPLEAVMDADRRWQESQRRRADADEAAWEQTKADEARDSPERLAEIAERLL